MFNLPRRLIVITLGVVALFVAGLTQLFLLRFEAGDVYPAYSSLRTDPLGTRVLFESLNRMAENSAQRNFRPPDQITLTPQTTLLICGLRNNGFFLGSKKFKALMDQVASSGGRLVLTFSSRLQKRTEERVGEEKAKDCDCPQESEPIEEFVDQSNETPSEKWLGAGSLGFDFDRARQTDLDDTALRIGPHNAGLPPEIPWRTDVFFDLQDEAWQTLYAWQDEPAVVQRPWGRGTVMMLADSYLFSNEALLNHRLADLLAWLVVPDHAVIFDEFHHGLAHQPGIATLARQYRLQGVFAALLVVAVLFIWRQTAVFVPPLPAEGRSQSAAVGRNTGQGLVDLARRHIPVSELLEHCFDAWRPSGAKQVPESLVDGVRDLIHRASQNDRQPEPVKIYLQICELLKQGKRK